MKMIHFRVNHFLCVDFIILSYASDMLQQYATNIYSQNGEDGIISHILQIIEKQNTSSDPKWCCEVGAWDGVHLSNTCNLIRNLDFRGILIEGDPKKASLCEKNLGPKNIYLNTFVTLEPENKLDVLLLKTKVSHRIFFLSIDIDGMDYWVWESLESCSPPVVCIEYNPTIPFSVEYIQPKNFSIKHGSSALALVKLAQRKGYTLQAMTSTNLIFVLESIARNVDLPLSQTLANFQEFEPKQVLVFSGYNGEIILSDSIELLWHGLKLNTLALQFVPKLLLKCPADFNKIQKGALRIFRKFRSN